MFLRMLVIIAVLTIACLQRLLSSTLSLMNPL